MLSGIIGALTSRLAGPLATAAAVALALALGWQTVQLHFARSALEEAADRIEDLNRDLGQCRANNATLSGSLARQNAALSARSAEDAQRLADAGKRLSEALKGRSDAEARAAKLLKAGPVGIDACARAMDAFDKVKGSVR